MLRITATVIAMAIFGLVFSPSLWADTVKLKSGQTYKGTITSEEEDRIQIKLEGSGARIWFARDQIVSLKKATPEQEAQEQSEDVDEEAGEQKEGVGDETLRAQELLDKLRNEVKDPSLPKPKKRVAAKNTEPELDTATAAPGASEAEIEGLINTMRTGEYYARLSATKRLGEIGGDQAIPHLIHQLDDEDQLLRQAANDALVKITGQNFGYKYTDNRSVRLQAIERWQKWYEQKQQREAEKEFKFFR
jgi:HEAT repeat protein